MEILLILIPGCLVWGFIGKTMAAGRGLNERSGFWLGFWLWFVGLIIVAASKPNTSPSPNGRAPSPPDPRAAVPAKGRLAELDALRSDGLISAEEYQAKRKRILEEL